VLGRAFAEAYKQASASSQYARAQAAAGGSPGASLSGGMTLDEATRILNVKAPQAESVAADMEEVAGRFKRLFDANDPQKGGSFYLQSKILRARERLDAEARPFVEHAEQREAMRKPRMTRDR
jgi:mitochondrial import inner membrane translocase subunit TIM16